MHPFLGADLGTNKTLSLTVDETDRVLGMEAAGFKVTPEIRSAMNKSIPMLKNMAMR